MLEKVDKYKREKLAMNKRYYEIEKHLSEVLKYYGQSKTIVNCHEVPKGERDKAASAVSKTEKRDRLLRAIVTFDYYKFNSALENDDRETCKTILDEMKHKNPINSCGGTALHDAAWTGNAKMFKIILDTVEFKQPKDSYCRSPLHFAASSGETEIVKIILEDESSRRFRFPESLDYCHPKDVLGYTPVHYAVKEAHEDIIVMILPEFEDKNPGNTDGVTPLHIAAEKSLKTIFKIILDAIKDLKDLVPENSDGKTPLDFVKDSQMRTELEQLYHKRLQYFSLSEKIAFRRNGVSRSRQYNCMLDSVTLNISER
jgi:hypothetical protein